MIKSLMVLMKEDSSQITLLEKTPHLLMR